ncbi:hypothetical protein PMI04_008940 [Sphingobium sp. AP49]|uniref:hypothetical protein n=1 Tax=Sphingobium sp. AP49 TaxID=1144307 RepID=UPI001EE66F36|nr:hypothetical protein [Sphingobium sp. AP49]WHO40694.1 hypothetical protein PMI04_008940 [Sphingobium sp. AP49]
MGLATVQMAVVSGLMLFAVLGPPARGDMLAIPLTPTGASGLAAQVVAAGAVPMGKARFGGGLVVRGDRNRLAWPLMARGVLLLAAPNLLCLPRRAAA